MTGVKIAELYIGKDGLVYSSVYVNKDWKKSQMRWIKQCIKKMGDTLQSDWEEKQDMREIVKG